MLLGSFFLFFGCQKPTKIGVFFFSLSPTTPITPTHLYGNPEKRDRDWPTLSARTRKPDSISLFPTRLTITPIRTRKQPRILRFLASMTGFAERPTGNYVLIKCSVAVIFVFFQHDRKRPTFSTKNEKPTESLSFSFTTTLTGHDECEMCGSGDAHHRFITYKKVPFFKQKKCSLLLLLFRAFCLGVCFAFRTLWRWNVGIPGDSPFFKIFVDA